MFTGLVQALGQVRACQAQGDGLRLAVRAPWPDLQLGESINVDGACLTVAELSLGNFCVDVSSETLARTTLNAVTIGSELNLERALRPTDRLGGHLVTGHVDQVVRVNAVTDAPPHRVLRVELGEPLIYLVAEKGSVCLNGVSLTINAVSDTTFEVMLIPHTLMETNLKAATVGALLNFEADLMARYAARWLEGSQGNGKRK